MSDKFCFAGMYHAQFPGAVFGIPFRANQVQQATWNTSVYDKGLQGPSPEDVSCRGGVEDT